MLAKILFALVAIVALILTHKEDYGKSLKTIIHDYFCIFGGLFIVATMIYGVVFGIVTSVCVDYTNEVRKDYDIQGLQLDKQISEYTKGTFVLGCGGFSSGTNASSTYYFFSENEYGKKLESISSNSYTDLYIKETDEESPCAKTIYQKQYLSGFWKWLIGNYNREVIVGRILTVPTNTIKIDYNVEVK